MRINHRQILAGVIVMMGIASLFAGCGRSAGTGPEGTGASGPASNQSGAGQAGSGSSVKAGIPELLRIRYESGGGMMYGTDFWMTLTPEEVVYTMYYPEKGGDRKEKEHIRISEKQWREVRESIEAIFTVLKPIPEEYLKKDDRDEKDPSMMVLDGGDYSRLFLTWKDGDTEKTIPYYSPNDRRFLTTLALMKEIADPVGREIPRYSEPAVTGVFFSCEKENYSFQCTDTGDGTGEHYLFVYINFGKADSRSVSTKVPYESWLRVKAECDELGVADMPASSGKARYECTLYYDDGTQPIKKLDKESAKKLHDFFMEFIEDPEAGL